LLSDGTVVAERHAPKDSFDGHQMSHALDSLTKLSSYQPRGDRKAVHVNARMLNP